MEQPYCIGGNNELNNNNIVNQICEILDEIKPKSDGNSYKNQITYIKDRAGHDRRYAIDGSKIENELGFKNQISFENGLQKLIEVDVR